MSDLNPLDHVEQILIENNWSFNRMTDDELAVKINDKSSIYTLFFTWQESMNALLFQCQYELKLEPTNIPYAAMALMDINTSLWMGHFEIERSTLTPSFRQTSLLREQDEQGGIESIYDMVQIALAQCERFRPVFEVLTLKDNTSVESISLAIMETQGES